MGDRALCRSARTTGASSTSSATPTASRGNSREPGRPTGRPADAAGAALTGRCRCRGVAARGAASGEGAACSRFGRWPRARRARDDEGRGGRGHRGPRLPARAGPRVPARGGEDALVADEVGLGKTVEAALHELARAERVLVLTPASLCEQWAGELAARFHLKPIVVERGARAPGRPGVGRRGPLGAARRWRSPQSTTSSSRRCSGAWRPFAGTC